MRTCYAITDKWAIADLVAPGELTEDWTITRINVMAVHRGIGVASDLLKLILDDADKEHVALQLEVQASDGLSNAVLRGWYERHGFRMTNTGYMRRPAKSHSEWVWTHRSYYGMMIKSSDTFESREACENDAAANGNCSLEGPCRTSGFGKSHYNEIERVF
jgi:ribosomal protein S18 acetylase RimI-like enzyme